MTDNAEISFGDLFPGAVKWDDPEVIKKVKEQAIAVLYASMIGQAVPEPQRKSAETVFVRLLSGQVSPNVKYHLTLKSVNDAMARAGLKPGKVLQVIEPAKKEPPSST
jgi:hypothetical protein